jgi:hypothetical protein
MAYNTHTKAEQILPPIAVRLLHDAAKLDKLIACYAGEARL